MPQELALYGEFTIAETLSYFGRIFDMPRERIRARTEFLIKFLDLPKEKRLIMNLSGGQQRRASLAAALLHEPELLILDEPTVGVDPLLRTNIWKHLLDICSQVSRLETLELVVSVLRTHWGIFSGRDDDRDHDALHRRGETSQCRGHDAVRPPPGRGVTRRPARPVQHAQPRRRLPQPLLER